MTKITLIINIKDGYNETYIAKVSNKKMNRRELATLIFEDIVEEEGYINCFGSSEKLSYLEKRLKEEGCLISYDCDNSISIINV